MTATSLDLSQIKTDALSSAATFRTLIGLGSSDAVTFKEATLTSGTVTSSTPVIDATQTWNDGATTFTGLKLDVTDTASASASLLMDLQVGGTSQFTIGKACGLTFSQVSARTSISSAGASMIFGNSGGATAFGVVENNVRLNGSFQFSTNITSGSSSDLFILRDAANTLAQRRGTNAQAFRLYNTYTSSTSFERLNVRWDTNELIIDAEAGSGGGTLRGIKLGSAATSLLGFYGATPVDQPLTVSDPAGGGTVDTEARTAIGAIIDRLQELGLIA